MIRAVIHFFWDSIREMFRGPVGYWAWILVLVVTIGYGALSYKEQLEVGLVITGMSDQVSWGFYIANFTFLVGVAAAAVLLVIPAYIFNHKDIREVILIGEGMAVAAVFAAMLFVIVDLGRPERLWHMIPALGKFNFPVSLLAWDVVVLNGYLLLSLAIPCYMLFCRYVGARPKFKFYFPLVVIAMFWAISIHTVTAFLFSANPARPFWHTSLLGPRFIASAFASGPALIIIIMQVFRKLVGYPVPRSVIDTLALIMAIAMQINLFFVGVELFTDFYDEGAHAASIHYLFLGLHGFDALRTWIWAALSMNLVAVIILTIHPLRRNLATLNLACALVIVGVWIEKGMGLVVPGFIPTPLGEVFEYTPTVAELSIACGICALGLLVFTLLAKASIAIELGRVRYRPPSSYPTPPR